VFGMTAYAADPEVMADTLAALPPEVRSKLEADGAREFAAHSRLIHGTETRRRSATATDRRHRGVVAWPKPRVSGSESSMRNRAAWRSVSTSTSWACSTAYARSRSCMA
jgi:hypothetical protein